MKPFSIKEHLEHPEWKVVTRDGSPARIICTDRKGSNQPILALVQVRADPMEVALTFSTDGKYDIGRESNYDLFFAPKKYEGWTLFVNCESICQDILDSKIYATREEAQCMRETHPGRYGAIVKLEWEDEQ